ncbi:MAG: hypothetical protein CMA63_00955 [Euryarchaeota archaeon]|nr:hypothetical protein [Euryarchaeota archaeon]|tara:strand:- start:87152 stop:87754 length:603 start_codon:yes stop_codon:yes gene_type:complete
MVGLDTGTYQYELVPRFMVVTRGFLRLFVLIFGTLVLVSYVYGVSHAPSAEALWGGIPWSQAKFIVPFMFLAAAGFLMYWWTILYQNDVSDLASLRWPWAESDGGGGARLLLAFALLVIPSALWLEATIYHIEHEYSWTPFLVIGILLLACLGNVMMILLGYSAYTDGMSGGGKMLLGSILLGIQCILFDGIYWNLKFPW